jgi:hypothetical protein
VNSVTVPYDWAPRGYQLSAWEAFESGIKRSALVWHRRAGKDLFALNWLTKCSFLRKGLYWHVFPTYRQGRNAIWNGKTRDGRAFLDHLPLHDKGVPNQLLKRKLDQEMTIWFSNESQYQVVGADEPDRLVGANPVGVIFSEWSLMNPSVWDLIRPILAENGGWASFIYTPRGRNHGWRTLQMARENPNWFAQVLTVDDTQAVPMEAIDEDRASGMSEEMIQQEYWCSFDATLVGAYYGDQIAECRKDKRMGDVPWDPEMPVVTSWDLGFADATSVWFGQPTRAGSVRMIDYYQAMGKGADHYVKMILEKPYVYAEHLFPHDVKQTEWGGGKTKLDQVRALGLQKARAVPRISVQDGINAVRAMFPRFWFDEVKCELGIQGLSEYTKKPTGLVDPEGSPLYHNDPVHNWASHPADALRTLAVGLRPPTQKRESLAPRLAIV